MGSPATKIRVVYPVPMTAAAPEISAEQTASDRATLAKRYQITKPYVLYVGVAFPHKNLTGLVAAWKKVTAEKNPPYQLVLVGKKNYFYEQLLQGPLQGSGQNIIYTDFVSDAELPMLYRNAALYVFPSLYEGFGLPALEALRYGVPVVSSNRTALPEVLQDAALYCDAANPATLAEAIWRGLTDPALRAKLIAAGHKVYPQYQSAQLAQKTWEIYQNSVY